jgi:hypothetical protein
MKQHAPANKNKSDQQSLEERLPYEPPQLIDRGIVSELTQSNGNFPGSDSAYS